MTEKQHHKWMVKHFPSAHAWEKADAAIEKLPESEPMSVYIDTWIAAYIAAGGTTPFKFG